MTKKLLFLVAIIFSVAISQVNQSMLNDLPPDLKNQIASRNLTNVTNLKMSDFDKVSKLNPSTTPQENDSLDSLKQVDSTDLKKAKNYSFYETLFHGDTINPDSQLTDLTVFGQDLFSSKNSTFSFSSDKSIIPPDYPINIDDEINILLWGRINEEYKLKVSREGSINIPRIGPVSVAGLNFETMQKNITSRIGQIEGVNVNVSLGSLRTIGVYIIGEVNSPGFYSISALSNVTNALFQAGGINKNGSLRNIQVKRNGKLLSKIDMYDFLLSGKDSTSMRLYSGDVIHVPFVAKVVAVTGNVRRAAIYEITGKDNLSSVLSYAGGLSPSAWTNKIQINRYTDKKQLKILDFDTLNTDYSDISVLDGDIIKIFPILFKNHNSVTLEGNVLRPGKYEYKPEMKVVNLISDYQQLLPETYLEYALILRQDPPQYQLRMIPFNLKEALDNPASDKNILLAPRDKLIVYNRDYFEPDRSVEIAGSITTPGKVKLLHNMTIRDLILQAGGLSEDASTIRGELYRRTTLKNDQVVTDKVDFCVECAMQNDPVHNALLLKSDKVFIRSKLGWEKEAKVTLKGQFNFPGTYIIFEGETLAELIERAGGFTKNAFLSAAIFNRVSVKEKEQGFFDEYNKQLEKEIFTISNELASKIDPEEAKILLERQQELKRGLSSNYKFGRVVVNLLDEKSYHEFALENGDELFIPRNLNTLSVLGEVFNPSTFQFKKDSLTVKAYIEAAGGIKSNADSKHIYVIKANGSIVTNNQTNILKEKPSPGDAIVIPQKLKYSNPNKIFVDTIDAIFKVASVVATILLITRS